MSVLLFYFTLKKGFCDDNVFLFSLDFIRNFTHGHGGVAAV
jgi:hypothetical protein